MQSFPHRYSISATTSGTTVVELRAARLPSITTAPPAEFDGPGDQWSPETLFVAAIADCYVLTFCAAAAVLKVPWTALHCEVDGIVDRVQRVTQFTHFVVRARLAIPPGADVEQATQLLMKAKHACLITNSLKAATTLEAQVDVDLAGAA